MSYAMQVIDHIQNDELKKAQESLDQALNFDQADDLYLLADSLFQLGFLDATKQVLNHLLDLDPGDDDLRIYLAEIAIEEGEDLVAIDWLDQIAPNSPAYVQSLLVAADYYQIQGLPEVAESKLHEAQSLMPDEPIISFGLAEFYYTTGQYKRAIHHYEETIRMGASQVAGIQVNARLGTAHAAAGDFDQALAYFQEALEEKEDPDTLFNLGITYFQLEEYSRCVETMRQLHSLDHTYTSLYPYLAQALDQTHQHEEAAQAVAEGLRLDKTNAQLYLIGANIHIKLDQLDQAQTYFQEAYALNPNSETLIIEYANFLNYLGHYQQSIDILQKAMDENDIDPQFYWLLASAQNEEENFDLSRSYFDQAYPYFKDNLDFLREYLAFLQEDGQVDQVKSIAQDYLALDPSNIEVRSMLERLKDEEDFFEG